MASIFQQKYSQYFHTSKFNFLKVLKVMSTYKQFLGWEFEMALSDKVMGVVNILQQKCLGVDGDFLTAYI